MSGVGLSLLGLFAFMGVFSLFWRGPELYSPLLFIFRGLFPNWQFFDQVGWRPRLFVRGQRADGQWSPSIMFIPRGSFRIRDLIFNPVHNLALAEQTLIENFSHDLRRVEDGADVAMLTSYKLVCELAWVIVSGQNNQYPCVAYQFDLRLMPPFEEGAQGDTILTSPILVKLSHVS